ncbi:hypothetical protein [Agromyces sp. Soil535]|uniref:hypothetical protein n=1 Tax=Agromyces sp. Soil535 TaxID=1736390 RepID=UPI0006F90CB1|nr:hypothetical protein [Agromyces sp. Soil535]KRE21023.1 hypothetical protein ASG80_15270 [Agromyces sp. Soil535]
MTEPQEQPLYAAPQEVRRVRSGGRMIGAIVMAGVGAVALVLSLGLYDALVELSSDYEGRRSGMRGLVAPGAVFFSAAAVIGGLVWFFAWSYRWERVETGSRLTQQASSYLGIPPQEATAVLERFRTGDPRIYLPVPVARSGTVVLGVWLARSDAVAYVGIAVRSGREWQALPLTILRDNAYAAISRLSIDHYGARASQTVVNGFLDPFLRN